MTPEQWLAANAIECKRWELRVSPATCERYQREYPLRCEGCDRYVPPAEDAEPPKRKLVNIRIGKGKPVSETGNEAKRGRPRKVRSDLPATQADVVVIEFRGEDADVVKRLAEKSMADGSNPSEYIATILDLFLDGRLALRR